MSKSSIVKKPSRIHKKAGSQKNVTVPKIIFVQADGQGIISSLVDELASNILTFGETN